ncbi:MAG: ABC transporter permease [Planctomycetota bacterium]|nr:ABC transporter permease [Planctomycetota bacterium]MDA0932494.1 ABC transporter permease [Planctomycetota bacterium]MDA1220686.1 ABC transporter permease [Planctomycetota bacterium]
MTANGPSQSGSVVGPLAVVVLAIAAWAALKSGFGIPDYLLPSPLGVAQAFAAEPGTFLRGCADTAFSTALGFGIATVFGVLFASALSWSRQIEQAVYPLTLLFQMVPLIAIAPLLVVWFGYGRPAVVASAVVVAVFPVVANTLAGLRSRDPSHEELFTVLGATRFQLWWKLALPSAVPSIVTGLRIAAGLATIGAITGEFLAGVGGESSPLGLQITTALKSFQVDRVFVCVLLAAAVGFGLFFAVSVASRFLLRAWMR